MFNKDDMAELRPDIWQVNPAEFYRVLPSLLRGELQWLVRSLGAYSKAPSGETVSNWCEHTFGAQLEDLTPTQLMILVTRMKAVAETRHELLRE